MIKYAILITYTDNHELRLATRPKHREFLRARLDEGVLHEAGPYTDDSGAIIIYNGSGKDEVAAIFAQDPFSTTEGIVESATIVEWNRVLPADEAR